MPSHADVGDDKHLLGDSVEPRDHERKSDSSLQDQGVGDGSTSLNIGHRTLEEDEDRGDGTDDQRTLLSWLQEGESSDASTTLGELDEDDENTGSVCGSGFALAATIPSRDGNWKYNSARWTSSSTSDSGKEAAWATPSNEIKVRLCFLQHVLGV